MRRFGKVRGHVLNTLGMSCVSDVMESETRWRIRARDALNQGKGTGDFRTRAVPKCPVMNVLRNDGHTGTRLHFRRQEVTQSDLIVCHSIEVRGTR